MNQTPIYLGIGCERGVRPEAVHTTLDQVLEAINLNNPTIKQVGTHETKRDETGLVQALEKRNLPVRFFAPEVLRSVEPVPNPSDVVERCVDTPSVCEAAALFLSDNDVLIQEKTIHEPGDHAITVAIARPQPSQARRNHD